jgi:hypothetical protein
MDAKQQLGIVSPMENGDLEMYVIKNVSEPMISLLHTNATYLLSYTYGFSPAPPEFASIILSPSSYHQLTERKTHYCTTLGDWSCFIAVTPTKIPSCR